MVLGCTRQQHPDMGPGYYESLRPGYDVIYYPKIQPGLTLDGFTTDLKIWFQDEPLVLLHLGDDYLKFNKAYWVSNIIVYDDRATIQYEDRGDWSGVKRFSFSWTFHEMLSSKIVVEFARRDSQGNPTYSIILPDLGTTFRFNALGLSTAQKLADALLFLQQQAKNEIDQENRRLALFEPLAAEYRSLKIKPRMPEEQRRQVVQADALNQQKEYIKAIERYQKAIEINPTSYPGAYFNLALLSAQTKSFRSAIFYMKHYLLLEPSAKDARTAQDKIYEWEFMLKK
jgi:tetratricopeptide (TPR) repeat protein